MRILITNDDGIHSEGIQILAAWARRFGEVTVIAPLVEQSAKSQSINIHTPFPVKKVDFPYGIPAYGVGSTPADCIRIADTGLYLSYDMVFSGINRGLNVGWDIVYSATCGAIFEAAYSGKKAVAFSTTPEGFQAAEESLDRVWDYIEAHRLLSATDLLNVNIPQEKGDIYWTKQAGPYFRDTYESRGGELLQAVGHSVYQGTRNLDLDLDVVMNGGISISPLTVSRTDVTAYQQIRRELGERKKT